MSAGNLASFLASKRLAYRDSHAGLTLVLPCASTLQFPNLPAVTQPTISAPFHPIWRPSVPLEQPRLSFRCTSGRIASPGCSPAFRESCCRGAGSTSTRKDMAKSAIPECGEADPGRAAVDELLLQDAFNLHKPILAICHGAQTLERLAQWDRWCRT